MDFRTLVDRIRTLGERAAAMRGDALDLVRIALGTGLFAKGLHFIGASEYAERVATAGHLSLGAMLVAHLIVLAFIGGGAMLALGLLTRVAAALQLPPLAVAIFAPHMGQGLFLPAGSPEVPAMALALSSVFAACGAGSLSADAWLASPAVPAGRRLEAVRAKAEPGPLSWEGERAPERLAA